MVHYEKEGIYKSNTKCVCGLDGCKSIIKMFRDIKDMRGEVQTLPNSIHGSLKGEVAKLNEHYLKRLQKHAPTVRDAVSQQQNEQVTRTTRNTKSSKKEVYIALWHFDNRILDHLEKGFKTVPKTLSKELATTLGIFHSSAGPGILYTQADVIQSRPYRKKPVSLVAVVPTNYNTSNAHEEIQSAKILYDLKLDMKNASSAARSSSSHKRKTSSSNVVSPHLMAQNGAQKRPRSVGTLPKHNCFLENPKRDKDLMKMKKADIVAYIQAYARHAKDVVKEREDQTRIKLGDLLSMRATLEEALVREQQLTTSNNSMLNQIKGLRENNSTLKENLKALKEVGGLKRTFLSSKKGVGSFPTICNQMYGFHDFDFMVDFLETMFEIKHIEPYGTDKTKGGNGKGLSEVEQCLLTLVYTNTLWGYDVLGMMFGLTSTRSVSKYVNKWLPLFGERGDMLSRLLPFMGPDEYDKLEPPSYDEVGLKKVAALIDGKDFLAETVRSDRFLNCSQASNKMHASAFRVLTWSLPCGIVIERTCTFLGRASEKNLMRTWGKHGRLKFPIGYLILGDKGFDNTAGCYTNYNTTLHPAFLSNAEFSKDQVNHNIFVCQKRYSCEVVYSRVTQVAKLSGVFRREWFHHFESLVGWAHGRANLCYGFLQDINYNKD